MKTEDFAYIVETKKSFNEAVIAVLKEVDQKGWTIFQVYDIPERLAAKGFQQEPLKIIEICSGKYAHAFLKKNQLVSLCLPCKINVFMEEGVVNIVGVKPSMLTQLFPEIAPEEAVAVEREIIGIINAAAA